MSAIRLRGATSGTTDVVAAAIAGDGVLKLPSGTGTLATTADVAAVVTGKILQVVSATYSTAVSTSSTSFVTTGLTATITPSSTSSKVLILAHTGGRNAMNAAVNGSFTLFRGTAAGTNLGHATAGMSELFANGATDLRVNQHFNYLDSPSTAAAQIYTLAMRTADASVAMTSSYLSAVSSIILMEVAA